MIDSYRQLSTAIDGHRRPSTAIDGHRQQSTAIEIIQQALREAVHASEAEMVRQLEPLLRATIRRALAEYAPSSHPFRPPGWLDRCCWHLSALFSSRTYDDIVFEKTPKLQPFLEDCLLIQAPALA